VQELEAKFLPAPGADPERILRRFQESLVWAGFRVQPVSRRRLADAYLDTADQQLRQAGWSLRQRDDGGGRHIALKEINRARAAIFNREEVEQVLSIADGDDALRPPQGPVQARLDGLLAPGAEVRPWFRVDTERGVYHLHHPDHLGAFVELAFDHTRIDSEEAIDFIEIELELKEGPHDLLATVLAVAELEPGLMNARLSKYERGLLTARCATAVPGTSPRMRFDCHSSGLEIASDYLKKQLFQIKLFEPYAWEGLHSEGVHQMRVAARRAVSGLRAFASVLPAAAAEQVAADLRHLIAVLGAVRDLDVQLAQLATYRADLASHRQERLRGYHGHLLRLHREARCNLLKTLDGENYVSLLAGFRTLLVAVARAANGSPLRADDIARASIGKLLKKVDRRSRTIAGRPSERDLHRLRRAVKFLRYQTECLQGAYGSTLDDMVQALKALQERLGAYQDACLARAHLQGYRRGHASGARERRLIARLIDFENQRARREREQLPSEWQRFQHASAGLVQRL
jgi:triphosphatase